MTPLTHTDARDSTPLPPLSVLRKDTSRPSMQPLPALLRRDGERPRVATAEVAPVEAHASVGKRKRGRPSKKAQADAVEKPTRKYVYMAQKEERGQLEDEVRALEEQVERLRLKVGLPTKADREDITKTLARSAEIDQKIHSSRQFALQLQSRVMGELLLPAVNPLAAYIHLPCETEERHAILRGLKDVKIRRAAEVGIARFQHLEANSTYLSEERFLSADGVYHCNRWEMVAFPQFSTVKQLYDALLFFTYNMEICVTEMVNQVAVREDNEDIEPTIWNQRMVAVTEDIGLTEELNLAGFAQYFDSYDLVDGAPLGVIVIETVDADDLYPYRPHERTRKDVQSFHLFCEVVDPETQRKSIVLKTCLLNSQLPPQFPVEANVMEKLYAYMSRWIALMNQYLSEYTVPS